MAATGSSSIDDEVYLLKINMRGKTHFRIFPTTNGLKKACAALDDDIKRWHDRSYEIMQTKTDWQPFKGDLIQKKLI